jgi:hypothetical protein
MIQYDVGTKVFGDWEITRVLGEGGFGKVFELKKESYGITAVSAMKIIRIPQSESDRKAVLNMGLDEESAAGYFRNMAASLIREIQVMSALKSHPGIVSFEDTHVEPHGDGIGQDIQIRMELLTSFQDYIRKHPLDEDEVIRLGIEISDALEFCRKKEIIHRDIKPGNLFVSEAGWFKLGDFGVARSLTKTMSATRQGTEGYMAPEVYLGKPYGASVDIYSLGLVLYQLMNGNRLPFLPPAPQPVDFDDPANALAKRMAGTPLLPPCNAGRELAEVILKACAFEPSERYRTAAEFKEALTEVRASGERGIRSRESAKEDPGIMAAEDFDERTLGPFGAGKQPQAEDFGEKTAGPFGKRQQGKLFIGVLEEGTEMKKAREALVRILMQIMEERKNQLVRELKKGSEQKSGGFPEPKRGQEQKAGEEVLRSSREAVDRYLSENLGDRRADRKDPGQEPQKPDDGTLEQRLLDFWRIRLPLMWKNRDPSWNAYFAPNIPPQICANAVFNIAKGKVNPEQVLAVLDCSIDKNVPGGAGLLITRDTIFIWTVFLTGKGMMGTEKPGEIPYRRLDLVFWKDKMVWGTMKKRPEIFWVTRENDVDAYKSLGNRYLNCERLVNALTELNSRADLRAQ